MGLDGLQSSATVATLMAASLAPPTIRSYQAAWTELSEFVRRPVLAGLFPVGVAELAEFLGSRYDNGLAAATLSSFTSAISFGHKIRGLTDPTADFRIRQLLAGARRLRPSRDRRVAFTLLELGRLCTALQHVNLSPIERSAFRAIFPLAFFALLRPGEIVRSGQQDHFLRLGSVRMQHGQLHLTVPSSKTSTTPVTIQLEARPDLYECPVAAVCSYLEIRGTGHQHDALFVGNGRRPITNRQLNHTLRQAGSLAGLDVTRLSGHCFRIGGASHAASIGMTELQISVAGRWSSQAMRRYLRRPVSILQATPPTSMHSEARTGTRQ